MKKGLQEQDYVCGMYLKVGKLILASVVHLIIEVSWGVAVFPARTLVGLFGSGGEAAMIASKRRRTTHLTTKRHIPEDWSWNPLQHRCENLKCGSGTVSVAASGWTSSHPTYCFWKRYKIDK
jgi:hypothetical protein